MTNHAQILILHSFYIQSLLQLRQRAQVKPAAAGRHNSDLHRRKPPRPPRHFHQGAEIPALLQRRRNRLHHGKMADKLRVL